MYCLKFIAEPVHTPHNELLPGPYTSLAVATASTSGTGTLWGTGPFGPTTG
jgi:hypothetical protein